MCVHACSVQYAEAGESHGYLDVLEWAAAMEEGEVAAEVGACTGGRKLKDCG